MFKKCKLVIYSLLLASMSGCNGSSEESEMKVSADTQEAFVFVEANQKDTVDLSGYIQSDEPVFISKFEGSIDNSTLCPQLEAQGLSATLEIEVPEVCHYSYSLESDSGVVTIEGEPKLTVAPGDENSHLIPLSYEFSIDESPVVVNVLQNPTIPDGYTLSQEIVVNGTAVVATAFDTERLILAPNELGIASIYYKLTSETETDIYLGQIAVTVTDEANILPKAKAYQFPSAFSLADMPLVINLDSLNDESGNPIISDPDGDELSLSEVHTMTGTVQMATGQPLSMVFNTFTEGEKVISYVIKDDNGGLAQNFITLTVGDQVLDNLHPSPSFLDMYEGETASLSAYTLVDNIPTEVTDLAWTSIDENIAVVNQNGTLDGVSEGTTTVSACKASICAYSEVTVLNKSGTNPIYRINGKAVLAIDESTMLEAQVSYDNGDTWASESGLRIVNAVNNDNQVGTLSLIGNNYYLTGIGVGSSYIEGSIIDDVQIVEQSTFNYSITLENTCRFLVKMDPLSTFVQCLQYDQSILDTVVLDLITGYGYLSGSPYVLLEDADEFCARLGGRYDGMPPESTAVVVKDVGEGYYVGGATFFSSIISTQPGTYYTVGIDNYTKGDPFINTTPNRSVSLGEAVAVCSFME